MGKGNHPNRYNQRSPLSTTSPQKGCTRKAQAKKYVDAKRSEEYSDIVEGDEILLNKNRENKLSPGDSRER